VEWLLGCSSGAFVLEERKKSILQALLTRSIEDTEELFLFLSACPKEINNSRPIRHAEEYVPDFLGI